MLAFYWLDIYDGMGKKLVSSHALQIGGEEKVEYLDGTEWNAFHQVSLHSILF